MATHARSIVNKMRKRVIALEQGRVVRDEEEGVTAMKVRTVGYF